jgi:hypothetical protein
MARHNREGHGEDQSGRSYRISYQPDWFYQIKVTQDLKNGRQSTKTLLRNLDPPTSEPGDVVRTRITCEEAGIDFEIAVSDSARSIRQVHVQAMPTKGPGEGQPIGFRIERKRTKARRG